MTDAEREELKVFIDAVMPEDDKASWKQEATEEKPGRCNARKHCTTKVNP